MTTMKKTGVVAGVIVLTVATGSACSAGSASSGSRRAAGAGTKARVATPPELPCIFPSQAEVTALASEADLIVEATVAGRGQILADNGSEFMRTRLTAVQPLRHRHNFPPSISEVHTTGGAHVPLLPPGRYVLFLRDVHAAPDGSEDYGVVEGRWGSFPLRGGGANRECNNYATPSSPHQATGPGQGEPVAKLEATIPDPLPPQREI